MKKTILPMITLIILLVMGCNMPSKLNETHNLNQNINLLADTKLSDDAYVKIIKIGFPAVPSLLNNSTNAMVFNGTKAYNHASSLLVEKPTVGLVSLYLIDCIIMNKETPHLAPLLITNEGIYITNKKGLPYTNQEQVRQATAIYEKWWEQSKYLNISEIQKISPLTGTNLLWWGMRPLEK